MTTLDDYTDTPTPEPPEVKKLREVKPDWAPKIIGFLGNGINREGYVYVSGRNRDKHLYRKEQGYAISMKLLPYLERRSVTTILIKERGTDDVYEYGFEQFKDTDIILEWEDRQACVPTSRAKHVWQGLGSGVWLK